MQVVGYIRAGESLPAYPNTRVEYGDVVRVLGPKTRIDQIGAHVGAVVRGTTVSDILTMALGLAIGYVIGYLSVSIGGIHRRDSDQPGHAGWRHAGRHCHQHLALA